jgi:hypothetical protein
MSAAKQQRCSMSHLLRPSELQAGTKVISGASSELSWRVCVILVVCPPLTVAGEAHTWAGMTTSGSLQGTDTQQGKFTGTQKHPTEVTVNGSLCGSSVSRELYLQPYQSFNDIWTKSCTWCLIALCKFWGPWEMGTLQMWMGWGRHVVSTNPKEIYEYPSLYNTSH